MTDINPLIETLGNLIEKLGLGIGARLPAERRLCEMLSISRTRLRELLKQLNTQGFLDTKLGSGTFVKQLPAMWKIDSNLHQLNQLLAEDSNYRFDVQEARAVLEGGTAWYASLRATPEDLISIRKAYQKLNHYQQMGDLALAADADAHFHLAIAEASHNAVLIQLMRNVFELLHHNVVLARLKMYVDPERAGQLNQQHIDLLQAIENRNPQQALEIVQWHIHYVIEQVKEIDEAEARQQRKNRLKQM